MDVWDAMCRTIMSAGSRRGAMMATMRCDHPDIEAFIEAKKDPARLRMFNLSVLVTDPFMAAVKADGPWELTFGGLTYKTLPARDLWNRIMRNTYDFAEPGVIFIDRINAANNLNYVETIAATNPCGEQPLPPYGACLLGSVNLPTLVTAPFSKKASLDLKALDALVRTAIRMMDNTVDASRFPLPQQEAEAQAKRRIGLGVTGLADALLMTNLRYGSPEAAAQTEAWMHAIARAAYLASIDLAARKGRLPPVRRRTLPCQRHHAGHGPRHPRRHPHPRHPQRPADLDRPDRHHQPLCRQCVLRHRAGLCLFLQPQGPAKGRHPDRGRGRRLCRPPVARPARRRAPARPLRQRPDPAAPGPRPDAGRSAEMGRLKHLQDHQLPRRHQL